MDAIHALTDPAAVPATRRLRELETAIALHPTRCEHTLIQARERMHEQRERLRARHGQEMTRIRRQGEAWSIRAELDMAHLEAELAQLRLEVAEHPQTHERALTEAAARHAREHVEDEERNQAEEAAWASRMAAELAEAQAELPRVREKVCRPRAACSLDGRWRRSVRGWGRLKRRCGPCR